MPLTRRTFLRRSGGVAAALIAGSTTRDDRPFPFVSICRAAPAPRQADGALPPRPPRAQLNAAALEPFVDPLPVPGAAPTDGLRASPTDPAVQLPYYRIAMRESEVQVHRDLKPTRIWGYAGMFPGPRLETRKGQGILVEWVNALPAKHFLPIDPRLHGAEPGQPEVRAVVHLHGAKVPPGSDGFPENWYTPGNSRLYHYPSEQDAAMLWYHDHAMGINRLNVYAGLLGPFFIRDDAEDALELPQGNHEIPVVLCDRMLDTDGQLLYPVSGYPGADWVPELFADTTLVNGKLLPYLEVEARQYRLRVLNASNSRTYLLSLSNGQPLHQIGTDQGLLAAPVTLDRLSLASAERADLIVDFAGHAGERIELNNGVAPLMQFRVAAATERRHSVLPATLRPVERVAESEASATRVHTLDEKDDLVSNPVVLLLDGRHWDMPVTETPVLGTTEIWSFVNLTEDAHAVHLHTVRFQILDRRRFDVSHFRRSGQLRYMGRAVAPEPGEAGWKDTVRADARTVTRIIVRFDGYTGRYVWHCHMLEHEDNDMMRPFEIIPRPGA